MEEQVQIFFCCTITLNIAETKLQMLFWNYKSLKYIG